LQRFGGLGLVLLGGVGARAARQAKTTGKAWEPNMEVAVNFEIAAPEEFRYHRPYMAVWLEDANGAEVRTLSLWVETSGRGPRWIPNLRRWYRDAEDAQDAGGPDLVATVSSATRMPGKYTLTWDGKDDKGKMVPQGTYTLNLESAREHGPYCLVQKEISVGPKPFKVEVEGSTDIKGATVEYRKRATS
jgi:hypothetical protein